MKIGIMGGTFDPIHKGHLMLADTAYHQFQLDNVWFLPNGNPPHKTQDTIGSTIEQRVEMVRLAIAGDTRYSIELYETTKLTKCYSYETMEHLKKMHPEDEFYFIVGADSLFAFEHWMHPERLVKTCTLLAACRDDINTKDEMQRQIDSLKDKFDAKIELLISPLVHVSSSDVRARLEAGRSVQDFLPESVAQYIAKEGLYGSAD